MFFINMLSLCSVELVHWLSNKCFWFYFI